MERTLWWFSNLFIAFSIGSSKFLVSVRRYLFSVISRKFTVLLKYWFKVFATSLSKVAAFSQSTKDIFVVLRPLSEKRDLTVFRKFIISKFI